MTADALLGEWLDQPQGTNTANVYQRLFELTSSILCVVSPDGWLVAANPAFYNQLRYSSASVGRVRFFDLLHPDDRATATEHFNHSEDEKAEAQFYAEHRFRDARGEYRWLAWTAYPDGKNRVSYIVAMDVDARRGAEKAVQESEARLAGILASTMDAIVTIDEAERIILFNPAAEEMFLCRADEALGQPLSLFVPEHLRGVHSKHIKRFGTTNTVHRAMAVPGMIYGRRSNGETFPIATTISQLIVNGQRLYTAIIRDVTEAQLTKRALRESEAYIEAVAESMPAALTINHWPDGDILFANKRAESIAGIQKSSLVGQQPFLPSMDPAQLQMMNAALDTGMVVDQKMLVEQADGSRLWLLVSMRKVIYHGEDAVMAISLDVTEQVEYERQLRELATIVEHSYDAIISKDLNGIVTSWNKGAERLYGYSAKEMIGTPVIRLYPPEKTQEAALIIETLKRGEILAAYETVRLRKDGERVEVSITISPLRNPEGEIIGGSIITHDITHQKRQAMLEDALAREQTLNKLRARFTSMVSHEFRTPLTAISSGAELLDRYVDRLTPEAYHQHLASIQDQIGILTHMLDDMLFISRAEIIGLEFEPQPARIDIVCRTIVAEHSKVTNRSIAYECNDCKEERLVDAKLLRLIIGNLVSNALKYSPPNTPVSLTIMPQDGRVAFMVEDAGIGIPTNDQSRIFETFHRASNVADRQGTGLGLAIVKQAVDAHQGDIDFESTVGAGTRFIVTLPAPRAAS